MICAIVPAAGKSRRMGAQKLLLPFGGSTVIAHIVDQLLASEVDAVYVVVGEDGAAIAEALGGRSVHLVTNPDPEAEMLTSIRCGLRALPEACRAVIVALGDQPSLTSELVNQVIRAYRSSGKGLVVPVHEGQRGHPLLLSMRYREEVLGAYDGVGLRGLLADHPEDVLEAPVPSPEVVSDMDCLEDYRREVHRLRRNRAD
jgi:molybdenum cofactor cytidylyltransferase